MTPEDRIRMALGGLLFDNIMLQGQVEELQAKAAPQPPKDKEPSK